ncbi:MAG: hypothetical protein ACLTL8_07310 [Bifidobacterium pseudocatenulatum]
MITDNFRQVIEYYHSLIEKGLMPKDILTRDGSQNTADISNDGKTAKVGLIFGWNTGNFGDLKDQYESIEVPAAPGVSYEETTWEPQFEDIYNGACVKADLDEAHKTAALKVIDKWITPDMSMESLLRRSRYLHLQRGRRQVQRAQVPGRSLHLRSGRPWSDLGV